MSSAAIPLMVVGTAASLAGGAIGASGQLRAAKDRAAGLRMQAEAVAREAEDRLVDLERQRVATLGAQRAAFGASGVKVNVGSPLAVLAETNYRAEIERSRVLRKSAEMQTALLHSANSEIALGRAQAASTLLSSFGGIFSSIGAGLRSR